MRSPSYRMSDVLQRPAESAQISSFFPDYFSLNIYSSTARRSSHTSVSMASLVRLYVLLWHSRFPKSSCERTKFDFTCAIMAKMVSCDKNTQLPHTCEDNDNLVVSLHLSIVRTNITHHAQETHASTHVDSSAQEMPDRE